MKILLINSVHYRRGGADVVYLNTGKLLEEHGHEVYYFSQENDKNHPANTSEYFIKNIDYFNASIFKKVLSIPRFFYSFEAKRNIKKLIKKIKPDIAHIHLYKADLTSSILKVLKSYGVPIVVSLHDYGFLCPHNLLLDGKMAICERCINGSPLNCIIHKCNRDNLVLSTLSAFEYIYQKTFFPFDKFFDTFIAVSKFIKNKHLESMKFNWQIKHLYNFFPKLQSVEVNSKKGGYMLFFGRLSKEKGVKTLIQAWVKYGIKSILKIVGTGELLAELNKNNYKNIEFLGFKQGLELMNLIKNASFIIVPSEWYENNPLTIIESYAYGKPVIGSNIGGIPEIILYGKTGFLFEMGNINDLADKIEKADKISNEGYYQMSLNARKFAEENFNPVTHYEKLIEIYKETIKNYKYAKE